MLEQRAVRGARSVHRLAGRRRRHVRACVSVRLRLSRVAHVPKRRVLAVLDIELRHGRAMHLGDGSARRPVLLQHRLRARRLLRQRQLRGGPDLPGMSGRLRHVQLEYAVSSRRSLRRRNMRGLHFGQPVWTERDVRGDAHERAMHVLSKLGLRFGRDLPVGDLFGVHGDELQRSE